MSSKLLGCSGDNRRQAKAKDTIMATDLTLHEDRLGAV
jgi:hypothetical protein